MKLSRILTILLALISFALPACHKPEEHAHHEQQKIIVTTPLKKDVELTQRYVCQIHSRRHIEVCALEGGYLEPVKLKEGQSVEKGSLMFKIKPILYATRLAAEKAEYDSALIEYNNTISLYNDKNQVVSQKEVSLYAAKLARAKAKYEQSKAELEFTDIIAPFSGVIDRQYKQDGSLIKEGEVLTTLSDNSVMWVYFNVPEARYLEYKKLQGPSTDDSQLKLVDSRVELVLANHSTFIASDPSDKSKKPPVIDTVTVEGQFNNKTGNIQFRADFPNPERLLRHGQTGNVMVYRKLRNAIVIPQRATFEILDKRYVFVVGEDHKVYQQLITIDHELEDLFVIKSGLKGNEQIVLEGVRELRDGDTLEEFEFEKPEDALAHQKNHAE